MTTRATPSRVFDHPGGLGGSSRRPTTRFRRQKSHDDDISACRLVSVRSSSSRAATGHPAVADRPSLLSRHTRRDNPRTDLPDPAERASQEAPERAEVVARYGSVKAALAWTKPEKLLRAAVAQWSVFRPKPHQRWTLSVDGHQRKSLSERHQPA